MRNPFTPVVIDLPIDQLPTYAPTTAALVIATPAEYTAVAERLQTITAFRRRVVEFFKPLKDKAHAAHKALCDEEKKALGPAEADEAVIKRALVVYTAEQDRLRREEQIRVDAEQRQAEETRRLHEAAALEREAVATGDESYQAQAEAVLEAPMPIPIRGVSAFTPPKVAGLSYRETYRAEVTDLLTLVKAVAAGQQPITLLEANQTALDGLARALKSAMAVPGVRVVAEKTTVARRGLAS